ncbi:MAG: glycosyltransferase [Planctomycetes bacterium]|nr:glycosyltransferase [Planctomycetota bacterium]
MGRDPIGFTPASMMARQRLGLPLAGRIVLYAGRFAPTHPLDLLMDIAPALMDRARLLHFVLIGDGVTRRRLEAIARARSLDAAVIFAGDVPSEEVTEYVVASDVGLYLSACFGSLPHSFSIDEVWPFLSVGRAIVAASDLPDPRLFVQGNNIGCAAEITGRRSRDMENLVLAISSMLMDDRARMRRAENARQLGRSLQADHAVMGFAKASMRRAAVL